MNYEYLNEGRGVVYTASGRLTGAEMVAAHARVNTPALAERPVFYAFLDLDNITSADISVNELRDIADQAIRTSRYTSVKRVIAIYAKDDLPFALGRMWQVFVGQTGYECGVFRERLEAVRWVRQRVAERFGIDVPLE
ncbi:MAG TPA: hypothetical protein VMU06_20395 [Stellaceae bacterium]|nr:hypothetical protein [Stellaceae bacterium]